MKKIKLFPDVEDPGPRADPFWGGMVDIALFDSYPWVPACEGTEQIVSDTLDFFKDGIWEEIDEQG